jgi:hypothetical protein
LEQYVSLSQVDRLTDSYNVDVGQFFLFFT